MCHTCPVCPGLVLGLLYHVKWVCGPAAGLQQARHKSPPSAVPLEGLANTATALDESEENKGEETGEYIKWLDNLSHSLTGMSKL